MNTRLNTWLSGRKTYIVSAATFVMALAAVMNGWGDAQINSFAAAMAVAVSTMRAGIEKSGTGTGSNTYKIIIVAVIGFMFLGGCAALGTVDPATGTSPAQDIVAALAEGASLFGPAIGTAVPLAAASILSIIIALGKVQDATAPPPPGAPPV